MKIPNFSMSFRKCPFSPDSGEKVADRPDEGEAARSTLINQNAQTKTPHPGPLPFKGRGDKPCMSDRVVAEVVRLRAESGPPPNSHEFGYKQM